MEKFIVSANEAGLCNRIRVWVSVTRLGEKLSRKVLVFWPKNIQCWSNFSDLFENKTKIISEGELRKILKSDVKKYIGNFDGKDGSHKYILFDRWRFVLFPGEIPKGFAKMNPSEDGASIDFELDRIPSKVKKDFIRVLKKLRPKKSIKKAAEGFAKKYDLENFVGVHIRRGNDYKYSPISMGNISSDERFIKRMKWLVKKNPKTIFFLCTDSEDTEKKFRRIFKNKIVSFPKTNRYRNSTVATQEALIDILLLSKAKYIIGTFPSTFSEMAWWFGGGKAKVEMIGAENTKKKDRIHKLLNSNKIYAKIFKKLYSYVCVLERRIFLGRYIDKSKHKNVNEVFKSSYRHGVK